MTSKQLKVFVLLLAWAGVSVRAAKNEPSVPRLVVLISIDQFRADYLAKFESVFLPAEQRRAGWNGREVGGFQYLKKRGAWFVDAHHDHYPLTTGPGHSIHFTGAYPYKSGIVGNDWYDRSDFKAKRYCVDDKSTQVLGPAGVLADKKGASAALLRVTTVGDELRMASGGRAKVWGLALKDRAAILMAGHLANGVLWFDDKTGNWIGGKSHFTNGALPNWVVELDTKPVAGAGGKRFVDTFMSNSWKFSFTNRIGSLWTRKSEFTSEATFGEDLKREHSLYKEAKTTNKTTSAVEVRMTYENFTPSPYGNEFVLETARQLIHNESLGQDEVPDILAINLSSNDYVGHRYGPDSAEVLDITAQTDRQLSKFFNWLKTHIPGGLNRIVIVLTSDHGVQPLPGASIKSGFYAGYVAETNITAMAKNLLRDRYGIRPGVTNNPTEIAEYNIYVKRDLLADTNASAAEVHAFLAHELETNIKGIYAAYTREQILTGSIPRTDIGLRVVRGFHPKNSGDIVLVMDPYHVETEKGPGKGTNHGSLYHYDTTVPVIFAGQGIKPGKYLSRASTIDIAPTLSYLLRILAPSGSEGRILEAAAGE